MKMTNYNDPIIIEKSKYENLLEEIDELKKNKIQLTDELNELKTYFELSSTLIKELLKYEHHQDWYYTEEFKNVLNKAKQFIKEIG